MDYIANEGIRRPSRIKGSVIDKSIPFTAYADDIAIPARHEKSLEKIETEVKERGSINRKPNT